jgi:hypothetical protein
MAPSHLLRWVLMTFLPGLVSNYNSLDLHLLIFRLEPSYPGLKNLLDNFLEEDKDDCEL